MKWDLTFGFDEEFEREEHHADQRSRKGEDVKCRGDIADGAIRTRSSDRTRSGSTSSRDCGRRRRNRGTSVGGGRGRRRRNEAGW
ncbi:MAG: hypothetical protein EBR83_03750, partial [Verrucomicrobia bacterium]|nr:hypothetical protein [Verrucomicrobiota bacterium]